MSLIQIAAPKGVFNGMVADDHAVITPGAPPPLIHPMCRRCNAPVEEFTMDPVSSPFRLGVQVKCHGKTSGGFFSNEDVFHRRRLGLPIWFFISELP